MNLARLIVPALRWNADTGFSREARAIADALELGVGGFIVFGGTVETVRRLTADLFRRAGRPLLIAADLERGAGQQITGLTQFPPPMALAAMGDPAVIRWAAAMTAQEARSVGINWVFAPVADLDADADNPIVQTRAFGHDPHQVAACVREWVEGCQTAGALACAKHYPGHGRTTSDSHIALPIVEADTETLRSADEVPFRAAIDAGVASVMTAHVAYPALDSSGVAATFSHPMLRHLRASAGFDGLIVTDALIMDGALNGRRESDAAVEAITAGADLLLYPNDPRRLLEALEQAMRTGALAVERAQDALNRYERALAAASAPTPPVTRGPFDSAAALADALLECGLLRGTAPILRGPIDITIADDDLGGPYPATPSDHVMEALKEAGVAVGRGGSRIVLVFAEPRAWKGRSGLGPETRALIATAARDADLVVLFGHPRLASEIPTGRPIVLAWHRQRLMQAAVARWLARHLG